MNRDEVFELMLGAERVQQEDVIQDIRSMESVLNLSNSDPFWGVIALIYARLPRDGRDWDALKKAIDRLEAVEKTLRAVQASESSQIDPDTLAKTLISRVEEGMNRPRRGFREWLGESARTVVIGGIVSMILVGLMVAGGIAGGYAAGQSAGRAQASAAAQWALSTEGIQLHKWANLNLASLPALLHCTWGGASKQTRQNDREACYPAGSGTGYYLPR